MRCQYIGVTDENIQLPRKVRKSCLTEKPGGLLWAPLWPEFALIRDQDTLILFFFYVCVCVYIYTVFIHRYNMKQ